jgi:hypothetical protein
MALAIVNKLKRRKEMLDVKFDDTRHWELVNEAERLNEDITTLNLVNFQIAELAEIKEKIEARIAQSLNHGEDYSKTYQQGKFKVTVTTGWNYSLDKEEYEIMKSRLPAAFDPVKTRIAYDLDKNILRDAEKYASKEEMNLLAQFISKKPKKLHVSVKAGV